MIASEIKRKRRFASLALFLALAVAPASAQDGNAGSTGGTIPLHGQAGGALIESVEAVVRPGAISSVPIDSIRARLSGELQALKGQTLNPHQLETRLQAARARMGGGGIGYRIEQGGEGRGVRLIVEIDPEGKSPDRQAFPVFYRSDRTLITATLGGGFGGYSDVNPWFGKPPLFNAGSPIARKLPERNPAWTEGFIEPGFGFATQVGENSLWAYGAITLLSSWSLGQDIYRDDARSVTGVEKAYAGFLYIDPSTGATLNVSAGRQNVTLNDGFLVHFVRGSSNAGARGGLYLGPRNANDFSVVMDATAGRWALKAFYIDPNELGFLESRSAFTGANVRYAVTPALSFDATYIRIGNSTSAFANPVALKLPREGVNTVAGRVDWRQPFGLSGAWLASELAHQFHDAYPMSAWAGYGLIGYRAAGLPWTPSLSYRYALASGDNPRTTRYERFAPLLSTGLGNWLQGITFGKLTTNSNLAVHRFQFNVTPDPRLHLTLDWHRLRAVELNNLGSNKALSQLSSHDLGQEFTASARWAINRNFYLQMIGSYAMPGKALREIGATKPWTTLQASLYWTL